jgi:outer membrane protein OmpA-like peptidoglycan-associated protein
MSYKSIATFFITVGTMTANLLFAQAGLVGDYYNGSSFDKKVFSRTDSKIDFYWDQVAPAKDMDPNSFSIRWKGMIKSPKAGIYKFRARVDDGIRVKIDGKLVIDAWKLNDSEGYEGSIFLSGNTLHSIVVEYFNGMVEGEIHLYWQIPGSQEQLIAAEYLYKPSTSLPDTGKPKPPKKKAQTPPPSQPVAAKPTPVSKDTLEKYTPKNIQFEQRKSLLVGSSFAELNLLAGFLKRNQALNLQIEGHTDKMGDPAKNLLLSEERAKSVADYLIKQGIAPQRIQHKGFGDTRPLVSGKNALNRRVAFIIQ